MGKKGAKKRRSGGWRKRIAQVKGMGLPRVPVTAAYIGVGAACEAFNLAVNQRKALFASLQGLCNEIGWKVTVNGYTVGAVLVGLNAAAAVIPWVGTKLNALLSRFHARL